MYPKLNSLLESGSTKGTDLEAEILELMKSQNHPELSLLEKTVADFITAIESQGMHSGWDNPQKVDGDIFLPSWCSNPSLISENFLVGELHFSSVDTNQSTTEETLLKTAVKGTMIEQIQRLTQSILQKKLVRGMCALAFIDETQQKHSDGSALKLYCHCTLGGKVRLSLLKASPAYVWFYVGRVWFFSNK